MQKLIYKSLVIILCIGQANVLVAQEVEFKVHIEYLASDSLEGRLAGSEAEKKAAIYIRNNFQKIGVESITIAEYFQPFSYNYNLNPHDTSTQNSTLVSTQNVIGYLNNNAESTIVIGAHYDHIGRNERNNSTLANSAGLIHNGADDNASGIAMLIELASALVNNNVVESSNFLFVCFSGEEDGLMGSYYFVSNELDNIPKISAMLNLDMVGRMDSLNHLNIGGYGTSSLFDKILSEHSPKHIELVIDSSGVGPSDHASFYLRNIPVLFFSTGSHEDYHKPSDDVEKINYNSMRTIHKLVYHVAMDLSNYTQIDFLETKVSSHARPSNYKVSLGIMPNYSFEGPGVLLDAVIDNRPAQIAGLLAGDIILNIGGCKVTDIYAYMDCLSNCQVNSVIRVLIERDEIQLYKEVQL